MAEDTTQAPKPTEPAKAGDPGYGLGIAGFVVSFFVGVAGLIMSAIALNQSKRAGKKNGFALAGLIIGIVKTALEVLAIAGLIIGITFFASYCSSNPDECNDSRTSAPYNQDDRLFRNNTDTSPTY